MKSRRVLGCLVFGLAIGVGACFRGPRHNVHASVAKTDTTAVTVTTHAPAAPSTSKSWTGDAASKNSATALGKMPPELTVDDWIGTTQPVLLRDQIGNIVLLVFCKLDDARCAPVHDQMKALRETYTKDGLVEVELMIDQSDDGAGWKRIAEKIGALQLPWAIGYGARVEYTRLRYGFSDVPAAYLIDTDGKVVWSGAPGPQSTLEHALSAVVKQGP